jgi:hypothetical protein
MNRTFDMFTTLKTNGATAVCITKKYPPVAIFTFDLLQAQ